MKIILHLNHATDNKDDRHLLYFVCSYYVIQALNFLISNMGLNGIAWTILSRGILAILSLFAWVVILKRKLVAALMVELFMGGSLLRTWLLGSPVEDFQTIAFNLLFSFIPMGLAFLSVRQGELIDSFFYRAALIIDVICFICIIFYPPENYSMTIGYILLLPLLISLEHIFLRFRWFDLLIAAVDLSIIILYGSRGPLLCVVAFLLIKIYLQNTLSNSRKYLYVVGTIILGLILFIYADTFVLLLADVLSRFGINSRTLQMTLSGRLSDYTSRDTIFTYYMNETMQAPLIGYGLAGSWSLNTYPHNVVVEVLHSYGIPLGSLILMATLLVVLNGLSRKRRVKDQYSYIFAAEMLSLFLSGSFIMSPLFFVGLASCLRKDLDPAYQRV